jgi:hypothetical protein
MLPSDIAIQARAEQPFKARGCSGAAVIQVSTGTVIGVLETADDPKHATLIGFKLLDLRKVK